MKRDLFQVKQISSESTHSSYVTSEVSILGIHDTLCQQHSCPQSQERDPRPHPAWRELSIGDMSRVLKPFCIKHLNGLNQAHYHYRYQDLIINPIRPIDISQQD